MILDLLDCFRSQSGKATTPVKPPQSGLKINNIAIISKALHLIYWSAQNTSDLVIPAHLLWTNVAEGNAFYWEDLHSYYTFLQFHESASCRWITLKYINFWQRKNKWSHRSCTRFSRFHDSTLFKTMHKAMVSPITFSIQFKVTSQNEV